MFEQEVCVWEVGRGDFGCCVLGHQIKGTPIPCDQSRVKRVLDVLVNTKIEACFREELLGL